MNEETLNAIKARYNATQFERRDDGFVVRARHDILALIAEVRRLSYRLAAADDLLCRYQKEWWDDVNREEGLSEDVDAYFLFCADEDDGSPCPSCGASAPFGGIFDDNLPRGMSEDASVDLEMSVRCPHCEADLVVTNTDTEYNVRVATWLDSVSGNSA